MEFLKQYEILHKKARTDLVANFHYKPTASIQEGIDKFVDWYLDFFEYNK